MTFKTRIFMNGASMIINVLIGKHQTSLLTIKVNKILSATDKDVSTKHLEKTLTESAGVIEIQTHDI